MIRRYIAPIIITTLIILSVPESHAQETTNLPPIILWDFTAMVSGALGYKDNVLQSSIAPENSGFFKSEIEGSLMRLSETDAFFMLFVFGEDIRYFDAPSVEYEQIFSATALGSISLGNSQELGAELNYLYQHQIFDASETQQDQRRLLILGHSLTASPYWKYSFNKAWDMQLNAIFLRQIYEQDLDDYSEGSGRADLTYGYGNRSEAQVYYSLMQRYYDTLEQSDGTGAPVPDTNQIYQQNEIGVRWKHYWDSARHWRTLTKISGMLNRDNGAGYYDYDRLLLRQQLRWKKENWNISGNIRGGWYHYSNQQIGSKTRESAYVSVDVRIERSFGDHWRLFTAAEHEWNMSNDPLDEYDLWMVNCGTAYEF